MFSQVHTAALRGVESFLVKVEVNLSSGLPAFTVVGLPHGAVRADVAWPDEPDAGEGDVGSLGEAPHEQLQQCLEGALPRHLQHQGLERLERGALDHHGAV